MDPHSSQQPMAPQASPSYPTNYAPPAANVNTTPPQTPPPQPRGSRLLLIIGIISILAILFLGTATIMYAYDVLSFADKSFQESTSSLVQGLPFMPKTPRYVLKASVGAHQKLTRFAIDASLALSSTGLSNVTGMNNFDTEITGPVDYTDSKNPILSLTIKAKEFGFDLKRKNYITYFRINKLPAFVSLLLTKFGIDETLEKQLIDKWFFLDTQPLPTDARKSLEKQNTNGSLRNKAIIDVFDALDDSKAIKSLTMKDDKLLTASVYHIHFAPTDDLLDSFFENLSSKNSSSRQQSPKNSKISKTITRFVMDTWIDKKDYYVRKMAVTSTIKLQPPSYDKSSSLFNILPNQTSDILVSFVANLSDFGKKIFVAIPENPVDFNEFIKSIASKIQKASTPSGSLYPNQFGRANNAKRKGDINVILVALNMYIEDQKGLAPLQIAATSQEISSSGANLCSILIPKYLAALPADPSVNQGKPIASCTNKYNTGYFIQRRGSQITLFAPNAENGEAISIRR